MSVRSATFSGMMNQDEADIFRRIQLKSEVERATKLIDTYWAHITFYRRRLSSYHNWLGHIEERLGEPEKGVDDADD